MGTIINAISIVIATFIGLLFKKGLSENLQKSIMFVLGLGLVALSLGWFIKDFLSYDGVVFSTSGDLLIILSLVFGVIIGEMINIDRRLNQFAEGVQNKYKLPPIAKGFVAGTLIFCVGAMAIVGALKDGISQDSTTLIIKSALDFITAMVLSSFLGIGVMFSALSVLIYQGSITILAQILAPLLTEPMIASLSMVGSILLIAMGLNFMEVTKIKVANMLPALIFPILYHIIVQIFVS
jgi:uncharacterized protein